MPRFTFSKNERLSSLKEIARLFEEGQSLSSYPLRLIWQVAGAKGPDTPALRVMFSVPKRKVRKAVDRNRIKRLMRESYRLKKPEVIDRVGGAFAYHLAFLFTGNELPDFPTIQKAMTSALERWLKLIDPPTPNT